ncbi:hypothetical protein E4U41_001907 [Claviceps citrina]|nr:hypothetical protein E4U41_001907 [Claviceps citrina]
MASTTYFYQSQIGNTAVINYSYTDFPLKLLLRDAYAFFVYCWAVPRVLSPLRPPGLNDLDELYPGPVNMFCAAVQAVLIVLQLLFLLSIPGAFVFPLWMCALGAGGFLLLNWSLCRLLNARCLTYFSDDEYAPARPEHAHEQWVYINGIATGEYWIKANLNRLALTFGRPVMGIHNRTSGLLFDIIECLIQRNLTYATRDIRTCYKALRDILYDTKKTKVIFILHSQGGIEGGLVIDWLLQELPQDLLSKLEVYTFGNAANHFNNPFSRVASQALAALKPLTAIKTFYSGPSLSLPIVRRLRTGNGAGAGQASLKTEPGKDRDDHHTSSSASRTSVAAKDRTISHIEHYAHTTDFVALWGVLHFATNKVASPQIPRFMGRLFSRSTGRGGHLLNQHYLGGMFPLKRDPQTGKFVGADEDNEFMEEVVKFGHEGYAMAETREALEISYLATEGLRSGEASSPVEVYEAAARRLARGDVKVKELSRLWRYRNGQSPGQ